MSRTLKVLGCDPSLRNWGLVSCTINLDTHELTDLDLTLVQPTLPTGKRVRQNSLDLESAKQLYAATRGLVKDVRAVFVEVPVGSQSARAMASYGICVGVLGSLRASGIPFFEVTPTEVKLASTGNKTATKEEMIQWAIEKYPKANWPSYSQKGTKKITETKAEHLADAIGSIHAGLSTNEFQQFLSFYEFNPALL